MGFFDSFRDFNEDRCLPGDPSFDDLYGGNRSGFYPPQNHYILDSGVNGIVLHQATFVNSGAGNWNYNVIGSWKVASTGRPMGTLIKGDKFTVTLADSGAVYTFVVSRDWEQKEDHLIVDMV